MNFFEGSVVSVAKKHSISSLILNQDPDPRFFNGILPLLIASCKNYASTSCLAGCCTLTSVLKFNCCGYFTCLHFLQL